MHPTLNRICKCPYISNEDKDIMIDCFKTKSNRINPVDSNEADSLKLFQNTFVYGTCYLNYDQSKSYNRIIAAFEKENEIKRLNAIIKIVILSLIIGTSIYLIIN